MLLDRIAGALEARTARRGFLVRAAIGASALAVAPLDFILRPGTAYAVVCRCGDAGCGCGSACCDGYTELCCTLTGSNACPPGTIAGGWWRADGSSLCGGGPRYYVDCHGECPDGAGPGFCAEADGLVCGCALGDCGNRVSGCTSFRYGQCHQEVVAVGRIACRVVTCTPAYLLDNDCTTTALFDEATAGHDRPCLHTPPFVARAYASAAPPGGGGLWLAGHSGSVFSFGGATFHGSMTTRLVAPVVAMAAAPDGQGYWLASADGGVFSFGSATFSGSLGATRLVAPIVAMAAARDGQGYWLAASDGGVFSFGSAAFHGSMGATRLTSPVVSMTAAPDGLGYWLVASDGGVFSFGSATFHGSPAAGPMRALAAGLVPAPAGQGYWLWGQDGSVRAFGAAVDLGDYPRRVVRHQPDPPGAGPAPAAPVSRLEAGGLAAFHAMVADGAGGYVLWAVSGLGPPPGVASYAFVPLPSPSPPPGTPPLVLPLPFGLPPVVL